MQVIDLGATCRIMIEKSVLKTKQESHDSAKDPQHHPGPEVIKLFSSSAQLSMKFQLLMWKIQDQNSRSSNLSCS